MNLETVFIFPCCKFMYRESNDTQSYPNKSNTENKCFNENMQQKE